MKISALNSKLALVGLAALSVVAIQKPMQAEEITVDFSKVQSGQSIEGMGTIHDLLEIDAMHGDGIVVVEGQGHGAYGAWVKETGKHSVKNGGVGAGGFADKSKNNSFSFSFAPNVTVSNFSLEMLDYGDWNPEKATQHGVYLTAFNAVGDLVDQFSLEHQTGARQNDFANNIYKGRTVGLAGDAFESTGASNFGETLLSVAGEGISRVELTFDNNSSKRAGMSSDPNVAFRALSFTADTTAEKVPEPASMLGLLAVGALGASSALKRQKNG